MSFYVRSAPGNWFGPAYYDNGVAVHIDTWRKPFNEAFACPSKVFAEWVCKLCSTARPSIYEVSYVVKWSDGTYLVGWDEDGGFEWSSSSKDAKRLDTFEAASAEIPPAWRGESGARVVRLLRKVK